MVERPLVFVDIDTQRDFMDPAGALYVPGATEILPNLQRLTEFARTNGIAILATSCSHHSDDAEFAVFPRHCMAGTAGQERVAATAWPESVALDVHERLSGELPPHLTLFKRALDVFTRPDADELISRYNHDQPTFVVYGVATDYCVRAAVEGLLHRSCSVVVVADAIRPINADAEAKLLSEFVRRGVVLTLTEVICRESRT